MTRVITYQHAYIAGTTTLCAQLVELIKLGKRVDYAFTNLRFDDAERRCAQVDFRAALASSEG
jgi:hypothetical protein